MKARKSRLAVPLWAAIGIPFFALISLTSAVLVWNQNNQTQKEMDVASQRILDAHMGSTRNNLHEFLGEPARIQRSIGDAIARHGLYDPNDLGKVSEYIRGVYKDLYLQEHHISVISFGTETGAYGGIRREDTPIGAPARFNLLRKDRSTQGQLRIYSGPDKKSPLLASYGAYDPRQRPWYRPAAETGREQWSPIYANYDERAEITISATSPVRIAEKLVGVVEADVKLEGINKYLREDHWLRNGRVAIVDEAGRLVAHSLPESVVSDGSVETPRGQRMLLEESSDPILREASKRLGIAPGTKTMSFSFQNGDARYFGRVEVYDDPAGINWRIVSLMPESDLVGDIRQSSKTVNAVSIALAIAAALIGMLLVRTIARPLANVARFANAMSLGEPQVVLKDDGLILETNDLARSLNGMYERLQESFEELNEQRRKLKQSLVLNRAFLDAVPEYLSVTVQDTGELIEVNRGFEAMTGWSKEEALGKSTLQLGIVTQEDRIRGGHLLKSSQGTVKGFEVHIKHRNGRLIPGVASLTTYEIGGRRYLVSLVIDVSEARARELQLQETQNRWAKMFAALPDYACITRVSDGAVLDVNPSFERITGWSREEAIGKTTIALGIWADLGDRDRYLQTLRDNAVVHDFEAILTTRSGAKRTMITSAAIVHSDGGDFLISVARDATEQRQQEAAIRNSNAMHTALFMAMPEYVAISELATGRLIEVSHGFERMTGWSRQEALGRTSIELGIITSEFREKIKFELQTSQGQILRLDGHIQRKDGVLLEAVASFATYAVDGEHYLATIASDVTAERQRERELHAAHAAKQAAETATQLKSEFLAMISHEIRTPLGGVIGMIRFGLKDEKLAQATREKLELGLSNAEALLQIINDILDYSKLEAGKMPVEVIDFSLPRVMRDALTILVDRAESKGLSLVCEIAPGLPEWWRGDPTRLRQVLINLMGNAIKFTENGEVRVGVCPHDSGGVEITVCDTGIGIAADVLPRLFGKFEQADAATSRKFGGTGLGLAICKRIVDAMGGEILVKSILGKGTTFTVSLPLVVGHPLTEEEHNSLAGHSHRLRILCAEDGMTNQVILRELISAMGHEFTLVEDGEAALEVLAREDFDLMLLDSRMPRLDGVDVLKALRNADHGVRQPDLAVIAITANVGADERARFMDAGAQGFLSKPIDEQALHAEVGRIMNALLHLGRPLPVLMDTAPHSESRHRSMRANAAMRLAFRSDGPRMVATLREALLAQDPDSAARAAHSLKGIAGYFSAQELQALAHDAEQAVLRNQMEHAKTLIAPIEVAVSQVIASTLTDSPADLPAGAPIEPDGTPLDLAAALALLSSIETLLNRNSLDAETELERLRSKLPKGNAADLSEQMAKDLEAFDFAAARATLMSLRISLEDAS